jgi:ABC-type branched-subunit amino acid transport system substrate-binding protein
LVGTTVVQAADTSAPGITDSTIRIGVTGALTGPVAALGAVAEGIRLRVTAANAAGGVTMADGKTRTIELEIRDDALDPQRTLSNVRKMVEQMEVFSLVGTAGTPNNQVIGRYLDQRGVPNLFMYSGVHELSDGRAWSLGLVPSLATEGAAFAEYLKANKPEAKVAVLYLNTETGLSFQAGLQATLSGSKVEIVAAQPVTSADPTVDTQLSTLKASGADTLVVITGPKQGAQAVRFARESGWNPTTLVSYIASSVASLKPAGLENARGVITTQFVKPVDSPFYAEDPGVIRYLADYEAVRPRFDKGDSMGLVGYLTGEALIRVLESMKRPTREAMMVAARNLDQVSLGLLLPGITLSTRGDSDIYPIESLQMFRFDGAHYMPVGGLISFDDTAPRH